MVDYSLETSVSVIVGRKKYRTARAAANAIVWKENRVFIAGNNEILAPKNLSAAEKAEAIARRDALENGFVADGVKRHAGFQKR